ncbi:MAG: hypothetical protein ACN6I3_00590 [bacterium]
MNTTRTLIVSAVIVFILAWGVWQGGPSSAPPRPAGPVAARGDEIAPIAVTVSPQAESASARFTIESTHDPLRGFVGEGLNAREGSAVRDLRILQDILEAWQTNFPGEGNPVGLNSEITRVLTGANRLKVAFVPPDHPAINAAGELCDRWGTPVIFHQIAKYHMELRSAGPDRVPYTADDVVWAEADPP